MTKVFTITWFKPSGEYYTTEKLEIEQTFAAPVDATMLAGLYVQEIDHLRDMLTEEIKKQSKHRELLVVCMDDRLGYPMLVPAKLGVLK